MHRAFIPAICLVLAAATVRGGEAERYRCAGRVVDSKGAPVASARVVVYRGYTTHRVLSETATDEGGRFLVYVTDAAGGPVNFYAAKDGLAAGQLAAYVWQEPGATFRVTLGEPGTVAGTVVDEAGKPVAGAEVIAWARIEQKIEGQHAIRGYSNMFGGPALHELAVRTDGGGRFSFGNIPRDAGVGLVVSAAGRAGVFAGGGDLGRDLQFAAGQTDIRVVLPREAVIEGKVIEGETDVGRAGVVLRVAALKYSPPGYMLATSGDDGSFRAGGLATGDYVLKIDSGTEGQEKLLASPVEVRTEAGKTAAAVVKIERVGILEVVVRNARTGRAVEGAYVVLRGVESDVLPPEYLRGYTGRDGRARIDLLPWEYTVSVMGPWRGFRAVKDAAKVRIERDKQASVEVLLEPEGMIAGKVVDEGGGPVVGAIVGRIPGSAKGETDTQGKFEIAQPRGSLDGREARVLAGHVGRNLAAVVPLGARPEEMTITAAPAVTLSGRVVDSAGEPIAAARMSVSLMPGPDLVRREISTGEDGYYRIPTIPPGRRYVVLAEASGFAYRYLEFELKGGESRVVELAEITLDEGETPGPLSPADEHPRSLVGRALPRLYEMGGDFEAGKAEGKAVLVYLWDFSDRGSRHFFQEFAAAAGKLEQKGIVAVTVDLSGEGLETVKDWAGKAGAGPAVLSAGGDVERARRAWGVRWLPWLVLADGQHVVRAQGFSVDEIGDKIGRIESR